MGPTITSNHVVCVTITVKETVANVRLVIVADKYLLYDLIIGTDYIDQNHIVLTEINEWNV